MNKIPKVIHYCWFSGDKKSLLIKKCIGSWKRIMPDYEIKCWDANSFDFDSVPFVKQAYQEKKWAFVSDYVRLYALYTEGGIYLDSDVKVFKRFDSFLYNSFFIGTEPLEGNRYELESAIMGSVKGHPFVWECLRFYQKINFRRDNGEIYATCPMIMTNILVKYGYVKEDKMQYLQDSVTVYSRDYFGHCFGTSPGTLFAIHFFTGSWLERNRGWLFYWCRDNDLFRLYSFLEMLRGKMKFMR